MTGWRGHVAWSMLLAGVIAAWLVAGAAAHADTLTTQQQLAILEEAQSAYDRGANLLPAQPAQAADAFREAAAKFELLAGQGILNGKLYYNLANAYFQQNELGRSILNYRRALAMRPGDDRVKSNLVHARSIVHTQIPLSGSSELRRRLLFWHDDVPLRWRVWIAVAAYVLFWTALLSRLWWRRASLSYLAAASAVVCIVFGISAAVEWRSNPLARAGVILADDVTVRKGNGEGFDPQFAQPLHQGLEFELLERRGQWMLIRLADEKSGWIRTDQAELVMPERRKMES